MTDPQGRFDPSPPGRERLFNAPLPALLIAAALPLLYLLQTRLPDGGASLAFAPADLEQGRWAGLFTSMLVHGGWAHVLMNAVGVLAFGAPVARLMGDRTGPMVFLVFYIACGALAAFGYALVHWGSPQPMWGASGAVFGLVGAATRLLGGGGRVLPLTDRRVVSASIAWMAANLIVGLIGYAPGVQGAGIAWEAHAAGFVVGLLAIGPLGRLFAPRESDV